MAQRSSTIGQIIGFLSKVILLLVLAVVGTGIWGVLEEPNQLRFTSAQMTSLQWPQHWQPVRIVVVSDLHVGSRYIDLAKLETLVTSINQAEPDVVLLLGSFMPGDFFKTSIPPEDFAPVLGKIVAKYEVVALPGRHDVLDGGKRLENALKKARIKVLSNSAMPIKIGPKKRFWIAGFTDQPALYQNLMTRLPKGEPVFAMVHNPARFPDIPQKIDVVFAGYTHGGLLNFPPLPLPLLPDGVPKRYAYGQVSEGDRRMFVTAGIGTGEFPIRLNNKPEVLVATIVAAK